MNTVPNAQAYFRVEPWIAGSSVLFIAVMATLVQSYVVVKLVFLLLFLAVYLLSIALGKRRVVIHTGLLWFYLWIGAAGAFWGLVGLLHPGNHAQGVVDALRLYVAWSLAFVVLYTLLRTGPSLQMLHGAMVLAGILVPVINLVGLYDQVYGLGLVSDDMREALDMQIGFGEGYIQITSQNIGIMFLVAPYLLAVHFRAEGRMTSIYAKVALLLSLALVAVSGRRALWLVVVLTPFTIILLAGLTGLYGAMSAAAKRVLLACVIGCVAGAVMLTMYESVQDVGAVTRLMQAFSADDERTIQRPYLVEAFTDSPILGSGFGGVAGYLRNVDRPWTYELTYYQLLFNMGVVGASVLGVLFSFYFLQVVRLLRTFKEGSAIPFALLVAYCSFLIGAYSNPYNRSFDLLFFVGLLPYLATFRQGFERRGMLEGSPA